MVGKGAGAGQCPSWPHIPQYQVVVPNCASFNGPSVSSPSSYLPPSWGALPHSASQSTLEALTLRGKSRPAQAGVPGLLLAKDDAGPLLAPSPQVPTSPLVRR